MDTARRWLDAHSRAAIPVVGGGSLLASDVEFTKEAKEALTAARDDARAMGERPGQAPARRPCAPVRVWVRTCVRACVSSP